MKQLQFYKYATWILLFLNLSMIAFFFLTPPPSHRGAEGRKGALDIMKLDEQQDELFLQLAQQHMQQMDDFDNQQRNLLKPYFNSLIDKSKTINSDVLLNQVQLLGRKKIESTYQHFQDVKSILRPDQHIDFEEFVEHTMEKILLEKKQKSPPFKEN